jgi:amino acid transporter
MARDGSFLPAVAGVSPRFATPVAAIVLLAAIATSALIPVRRAQGRRRHRPADGWVWS